MAFHVITITLLVLIMFALAPCMNSKDLEVNNDLNMVKMAYNMVVQANNWAKLSVHDESSLIFGHHRRHHGRGGGGGGLRYEDDFSMDGHGSDDNDDDSTVGESLIFGHHRHHRRHHGGGGGHGGLRNDDNLTGDNGHGEESSLIFGHHRRHHGGRRGGGGGGGDDDDSTVDESLIFGHHRHHRRHHGGGSGGGGHGGLANDDNLMTKDGHDEIESSLIFGHHRRHHGGGRGGGGGGGGHGGLTTEDNLMTVDSHGGHHGGHHGSDDVDDNVNNSTLNDSLILGHHRHDRRHHGGGGGGHGRLTNNNDTMTEDGYGGHHGGGRGGHHGGGGHGRLTNNNDTMTEDGYGGHHGGGRGGHHGGGGHGGLTNNNDTTTASSRGGGHDGENDNSQTYDNTLIFGRGKHHGGGRGSGGGHHGGRGHDDDDNNLNLTYNNTNNNINNSNYNYQKVALTDCAKLYDQAEPLLARLLENNASYTREDGLAWLTGTLTSHRTCLDGLKDRGMDEVDHPLAQNLTMTLNVALALHAKKLKAENTKTNRGAPWRPRDTQYKGLLSSWNPATSRADIVVAKDGSGNYRTINEAVNVLERMMINKRGRGGRRVVVHVKAGIYDENVEIGKNLRNVMFVGEGVDNTIVTGRRNYIDGDSTVGSATFRVFGDGFWAKDITFENTAGPEKHQAVALMVASDNALFYKCNIKGYQDTLYVHSLRQFYRDCKISGTIDFIFGNAAAVFQNCEILVRRPMNHQVNIITAQGRNNPYENTGISIHGSRIRPAPELIPVKGSIKTFLGRPWKKYSRTVIAKTDIDGIIHPKGWTEWRGDFALSTLYYAEYMNTGLGSGTRGRVNWPGYHVLKSPREFGPFNVRNFIQGESWIMKTGVPVWTEI